MVGFLFQHLTMSCIKFKEMYQFRMPVINNFFIIFTDSKLKSTSKLLGASFCWINYKTKTVPVLQFAEFLSGDSIWLLIRQRFFKCYLPALRATLGHCQGDNLTNPILISAFDTCSTWRSPGASQRSWVTKPSCTSSGVWTRTLPIMNVTP